MAKNNTITLNILGDSSSAKRALNEVDGHAQQFGGKMKSILGAVGGVAAAKGVFEFAKGSVAAFTESEQAAVRLQDAFDKFPKLADSNVATFEKLNESLAKKTKFDDDATASGQAVLAQFNMTGKQIQQLTPLLQDYAAKTGKDLPAAAEVLGKAMMGNAKALKEVGINIPKAGDAVKGLTRAQEKAESAATKMESAQRKLADLQTIQATKTALTVQDQIALRNAQEGVKSATEDHSAALAKVGRIQDGAKNAASQYDQVMAGLRAQVGGFAEKEGTTAAGKAEILKNQFGELQETVGAKLMPVLITLSNWGLKIVDFFANLSPGVQATIGVAVGLAAAAFVVVQAVQAWTAVQAALNVVMSANPIGLVVVAIAALVAGFVWAYKNVDWFRAGVQGVFAALATSAQWLGRVFAGVWDWIVAGFRWVADAIKSRINFVIRLINGLLGGINKVSGGLNRIPGVSVPTFAAIPELAKGGTAVRGGSALVGENGPELINMPTGASVIPLAREAGTVVHFTLHVDRPLASAYDIADAVVPALREFFGRGGALTNGRGGSLRPA